MCKTKTSRLLVSRYREVPRTKPPGQLPKKKHSHKHSGSGSGSGSGDYSGSVWSDDSSSSSNYGHSDEEYSNEEYSGWGNDEWGDDEWEDNENRDNKEGYNDDVNSYRRSDDAAGGNGNIYNDDAAGGNGNGNYGGDDAFVANDDAAQNSYVSNSYQSANASQIAGGKSLPVWPFLAAALIVGVIAAVLMANKREQDRRGNHALNEFIKRGLPRREKPAAESSLYENDYENEPSFVEMKDHGDDGDDDESR